MGHALHAGSEENERPVRKADFFWPYEVQSRRAKHWTKTCSIEWDMLFVLTHGIIFNIRRMQNVYKPDTVFTFNPIQKHMNSKLWANKM